MQRTARLSSILETTFGREIGFIRRTRGFVEISAEIRWSVCDNRKNGINTYRIRALDANDEELIHAEHLKPYVGATPSDDEQEKELQTPRESAAILVMRDPPVASERGGRFTYPFFSTRA